ncbi:hypothetical protein [Flavonifractor sp. An91]|uniref:hypothetical protein n=1 Tax=Flavonifractor sp. An91 TaxID=1965665 RepID=UPI000B379788|nr:hypothetical protein [Flavonifractor sp. An91]OUN13292.1 hypothetical protein B5G42_04720 [Flavonifractor sp. An91]
MFSYKDILVNYAAMVNDATSKEVGIKEVKADWVEKKAQIDDIYLTSIVDVGIEVLEKSRTSFDIKGFLEYKGLSESDVYNVPFDLVYLLWNLTDAYNNSVMKAFLEDIASRMQKNMTSLSTTMRELQNDYNESGKDSKEDCFDSNFKFYLSDARVKHILGIDGSSEVEKELWSFVNACYDVSRVMSLLYPDLYKSIKNCALNYEGVE